MSLMKRLSPFKLVEWELTTSYTAPGVKKILLEGSLDGLGEKNGKLVRKGGGDVDWLLSCGFCFRKLLPFCSSTPYMLSSNSQIRRGGGARSKGAVHYLTERSLYG